MSPSPDAVVEKWSTQNLLNDSTSSFSPAIQQAFDIAEEDDYEYRSEGFSMPLARIQEMMDSGTLKYWYRGEDGKRIKVPRSDIDAYTQIFAPSVDAGKTLKSFAANAKKGSPRSMVAEYLLSKRLFLDDTLKVPKRKAPFPNPYHDIWAWSCRETEFVGPLGDPHYATPAAAKHTHPMLPVLYHHFGCVCPSWEALNIIAQLAKGKSGVIDMGSGNGYWTYMLRRLSAAAVAVDNGASTYRFTWIPDTIKTNGVDYIKQQPGGGADHVLLMVYMVTRGTFTKQVLKAFGGDTMVVVGTQNANRFTMFADATVEEYFAQEMPGWELKVRVALPSFAGKDEAMYVYRKGK